MAKTIGGDADGPAFRKAVEVFRKASFAVALTGAGISVECGIPDFRSADGIWSVFDPVEYGTLDAFLHTPDKAWKMYRALGAAMDGKEPGPAHLTLAELERRELLRGVVTQNIDGLHKLAGSRQIVEVHGEARNLQCLQCGRLTPIAPLHFKPGPAPDCPHCRFPLKPNVVLYGELVRDLDRIEKLLGQCDLLMVIGTSAEVYPVAEFPIQVKRAGGLVLEFNLESTPLTPHADFFFEGKAGQSLPAFAQALSEPVE